jgi:hypothetical protein
MIAHHGSAVRHSIPVCSCLMARTCTATPAGIRMVRGERPDFRPTMIYAHP